MVGSKWFHRGFSLKTTACCSGNSTVDKQKLELRLTAALGNDSLRVWCDPCHITHSDFDHLLLKRYWSSPHDASHIFQGKTTLPCTLLDFVLVPKSTSKPQIPLPALCWYFFFKNWLWTVLNFFVKTSTVSWKAFQRYCCTSWNQGPLSLHN